MRYIAQGNGILVSEQAWIVFFDLQPPGSCSPAPETTYDGSYIHGLGPLHMAFPPGTVVDDVPRCSSGLPLSYRP